MRLLYKLVRGECGFGIDIDSANRIVKVHAAGKADLDGLAREGDKVVAVDGVAPCPPGTPYPLRPHQRLASPGSANSSLGGLGPAPSTQTASTDARILPVACRRVAH